MKFSFAFAGAAAVVALGFQRALRSGSDPEVFDFPVSTFAKEDRIEISEQDDPTLIMDALGAESFVEDPLTGDIYTGVADGGLLRLTIKQTHRGFEVLNTRVMRVNSTDVGSGAQCGDHRAEQHCGRVLGLRILRTEDSASLIACEGSVGLIRVDNIDSDSRPHKIQILTGSVTNSTTPDPIHFCNSLAIRDGAVFFTDSSKRPRTHFIHDVFEARGGGRLLRYDFHTGVTSVIRDDIAFANGLTLTHEGDALLLVELMRSKVWRYQLTGPQAGEWFEWGVVPFLPDNIQKFNDGSSYMVGGAVWRTSALDKQLSKHYLLRKIAGMVPASILEIAMKCCVIKQEGYGAVFDAEGNLKFVVDGASVGARHVSEVYATSSGFLLWGSFDVATPLLITRQPELEE